jgi:aminoglycoside phosphotransferase (APT) family kinase protein
MSKNAARGDRTGVFDLTQAQLHEAVAAIAGEPVVSFEVAASQHVRGRYGFSGEKVIPTFCYETRSGRVRETTVFVKRHYDDHAGHREAHHYSFLTRHGAPVARLYQALTDHQHREILFLEHLDVVAEPDLPFAETRCDAGRFPAFLAAFAQLHAIQPCDEYAALLREDMVEREWSSWWAEPNLREKVHGILERVWECAVRGEVGNRVASLCQETRSALGPLRARTELWASTVSQLPVSLAHNDCYPDCVGWRPGTSEAAIFDLEDMGYGPRFFDVAPWIAPPDEVQRRCWPREKLAQHYLSHFERTGGEHVPQAQFLEEGYACWLIWVILEMEAYLGRALLGPADRTMRDSDEFRRRQQEGAQRHLGLLLHEADRPQTGPERR